MNLKQEAVDSIKRETNISKLAIEHLRKGCETLEKKYHMSTGTFIKKFNNGSLGDDQNYFKWFSLSEGLKDWQKTKNALRELLK